MGDLNKPTSKQESESEEIEAIKKAQETKIIFNVFKEIKEDYHIHETCKHINICVCAYPSLRRARVNLKEKKKSGNKNIIGSVGRIN